MVDRDAIRSNALYLRSVRPIDPEEITEYVEGTPHPAVIRQVLREEAVDLGLLEREDGTFVPVPDEPLSPAFHGVEAFPDRYAERLETLLVDRFGPAWYDGESGDRLRARVRRIKESYLHGARVEYDRESALSYACYHLPGYYAAIQYVLDELGSRGLLDRQLRVLDVGAGVGGPALGLIDYAGREALIDYHAVEPGEAVDVLEALLSATGETVRTTVHRSTAETFDPGRAIGNPESAGSGYDLILFANVLSELEEPVCVLERYVTHLAEDGALILLAPADKNTSLGLRECERALVDTGGGGDVSGDGLDVYAPTLRLWPHERPTDECWSFDVRPDLAVPRFQRALDEGARAEADGPDGRAPGDCDREPGDGEFVNVDVQYSYAIVRRDGIRRHEFRSNPRRYAKMADMQRHVTDRIDLAAVKLSHSLSEAANANPVYRIGDGSESIAHFAVLARETSMNRDLQTAGYGDVLTFENVLVLWNDDEGAYNLVVDDGTIVERIPPE